MSPPPFDDRDPLPPTDDAPVPAPRKKRKWLRRLVKWGLGGIFGLIGLVLLLLIFLPLDWAVHSLVLPKAHEMLDQDNIEIGEVEWSLTGGFEFHDIRVGPPKGYTKDILTLKRMAVHYDLFSIVGGDFQLREVSLDAPHVFMEIKDGKPAVVAMLEKLPKSEPPPPEEPGGPPPKINVVLHKIAVTDFRAGFDDGNAKAEFGAVDVGIDGNFSFEKSHIRLKVGVGGTPDGQPNIHVKLAQPNPTTAELEMKTALEVNVDIGAELDKPKVDIDLNLFMVSTKLDAPGLDLPPIKLTARTTAQADVKADTAGIKLLTAEFNGEEILRMKANLEGLKKQNIVAQIEKVRLPFPAFVPYVKPFLPPGSKFELFGEAGLENFLIEGDGEKLAAEGLPSVTGRLFVRGFGVDVDTTQAPAPAPDAPKPLVVVPPLAALVKDIGVEIDVGVNPAVSTLDAAGLQTAFTAGFTAPPETRPSAMLKGTVGVGLVDGFGAKIERLALNLAAGATLSGRAPTDVGAALDLQIPVIQADVPGQGKVALSFGTALQAGGNLRENSFSLDRLTVNVSDTIKVGVDAFVKNMGQGGFAFNTRVEPISIPRALGLAPPGARAKMPAGMALGGSVDTTIHVSGELPPLEELKTLGGDLAKVFALPVKFEITQGFNGLSVGMPGARLGVAGLDGAVRVSGTPANILIEAPANRPLGIGRISKDDLGVVIKNLAIPLKLRFQPGVAGQSLELDTGVRLAFEPGNAQGPKAMNLRGGMTTALHVQGRLPALDRLGSLGGDMGRLLALPVNFDLSQRFQGMSVGMPAKGLKVENLNGTVRVSGRPSDITIESPSDAALGIGRIVAEEAGAVVENLGLPMKLRLLPGGGGPAVDGHAGVTVSRVTQKAKGVRVEGIAAKLTPQIKLPVARALGGGTFDIEKIDVGVQFGLEALSLRQPGKTIRIANKEKGAPGTRTKVVQDQVRLSYDPNVAAAADGHKYPLTIGHTVKLGNLNMRESRLDVKNLVVEQRIDVAGLQLSGLKLSQPVPASKPRYVQFTTHLVPNRDADAEGTDEQRRLAITVGGTPLDRAIAENELEIDIKASLPRLRYPPIDAEVYAELDRLDVKRLEFFNHSHGVHFSANGVVKNFVLNGTAMPAVDLSMFAGIDLPAAVEKAQAKHMVTLGSVETHDKLSVAMAGKVGVEARVRNLDAQSLELKGVLVGENCHVWSEKHGQDPSLPDGTQLYTVQNVHLKNLTMHSPMVQRVDLDMLSAILVDKNRARAFFRDVTKLWPAARDVIAAEQSPLHHTMQSYSNAAANVTIDGVDVDKEVTYVKSGRVLEKAHSPLVIDRVALNMGYENWVFDIDRLYIQMMGGDIGGRVGLQLKGLAPPDLNLVMEMQIGGINLAALNPRRDVKKKYSAATEVKVDADLAFGWKNRDVDGGIKISKLSLRQLDELLKFSDPGGRNQQIQDQRTLFQRVSFLNPSVQFVNLEFEYANMDLETKLDAIPGVRGALNAYLDGIKVEGLDARQVVENFIAELNFIPPVREPPEIGPAPDEEGETAAAAADSPAP